MFGLSHRAAGWSQKCFGLLIAIILGMTVCLTGCSENPVQLPAEIAVLDPAPVPDADKAAPTRINCQGTKCTQPGEMILPGYLPRNYSYIVRPGVGGITRVDIGIDHAWYQLSGMVMPPGWTYTTIPGDNMPHNPRMPAAPHGQTRNINGSCNAVIRWTGPAMYTPFQLAYNWNGLPHVVEWDTSDGAVANWSQRIGKGYGPVHAPKIAYVPGDVVGIKQW